MVLEMVECGGTDRGPIERSGPGPFPVKLQPTAIPAQLTKASLCPTFKYLLRVHIPIQGLLQLYARAAELTSELLFMST